MVPTHTPIMTYWAGFSVRHHTERGDAPASHPQDTLGIAVSDLLAVRVADRKFFQEFHSRGVRLVGPVHGEQDIVSAEREQRAQERGLVPVAAGGDEQIVLEILQRRLLKDNLLVTTSGNWYVPAFL